MSLYRVPRSLGLLGILLAVTSSVALPSGSASVVDNYCNANPYGIDGSISEDDAAYLSYLAFPQTVGDMRNRFGSPRCLDERLDYYKVEGTESWIGIEYSGANAYSYRRWNGAE